jgi:hypothetical protein
VAKDRRPSSLENSPTHSGSMRRAPRVAKAKTFFEHRFPFPYGEHIKIRAENHWPILEEGARGRQKSVYVCGRHEQAMRV